MHKKNMHILMTRFPYESSMGGEEWHTIELAKKLREKGHEVYFLGSCPILLEAFQKEGFQTKKAFGGKMAVTPISLLLFLALKPYIAHALKKAFKQARKKWNIDTLYCLSLNEKIILTPVALKKKIQVTWVEHQQIRDWLLKSPLKIDYVKLSSKVKVIPISEENKKKLQSIHTQNLIDIPNGIEPLGEKIPRKDTWTIGYAGRLTEKKGVNILIEAIAKLDKETKEKVHLSIMGDGPEKQNLENLAKKEGVQNITFHGHLQRETYKEAFLQSDIIVLPSVDTAETFGLIIAEAMMSGIPTIVTQVSGITSHLEDKKDSLIIEPKDSRALTQAIQKLIQDKDLYDRISKEGKKKAEEKFSLEKMIDTYEQTLLQNS